MGKCQDIVVGYEVQKVNNSTMCNNKIMGLE